MYVEAVRKDVLKFLNETPKRRSMDNLTRPEMKTMFSLRTWNDIIVKQADKGSATVVMSKEDYMTKVMQHLNKEQHYRKLDEDRAEKYVQEITTFLTDMVNLQVSDMDGYSYLHPCDTRTLRFYVLPKIHKPGNPGRPTLLTCGSPIERISKFVDFYLNPLVNETPSYIKDTKHFLSELQELNNSPSKVLLVTLGVTSLYMNIPHDEGIETCRAAVNSRIHH